MKLGPPLQTNVTLHAIRVFKSTLTYFDFFQCFKKVTIKVKGMKTWRWMLSNCIIGDFFKSLIFREMSLKDACLLHFRGKAYSINLQTRTKNLVWGYPMGKVSLGDFLHMKHAIFAKSQMIELSGIFKSVPLKMIKLKRMSWKKWKMKNISW